MPQANEKKKKGIWVCGDFYREKERKHELEKKLKEQKQRAEQE